MNDKTIIPEIVYPDSESGPREDRRFSPAPKPKGSLFNDLRTFAGGLLVAAGIVAAVVVGGVVILTIVALFGVALLLSRLFGGFRRGPSPSGGASVFRSVIIETQRPGQPPRRVVRTTGTPGSPPHREERLR